ncbi:MAG: hypothetical protein L0170_02790, partial [Acidobacteria bacterium]|nr:hypothetical protein [Acidobacteriota bacterium]
MTEANSSRNPPSQVPPDERRPFQKVTRPAMEAIVELAEMLGGPPDVILDFPSSDVAFDWGCHEPQVQRPPREGLDAKVGDQKPLGASRVFANVLSVPRGIFQAECRGVTLR